MKNVKFFEELNKEDMANAGRKDMNLGERTNSIMINAPTLFISSTALPVFPVDTNFWKYIIEYLVYYIFPLISTALILEALKWIYKHSALLKRYTLIFFRKIAKFLNFVLLDIKRQFIPLKSFNYVQLNIN